MLNLDLSLIQDFCTIHKALDMWLSDLDLNFHFQTGDRHRHVNTWVNLLWTRLFLQYYLSLISHWFLNSLLQVRLFEPIYLFWLCQLLEVACPWWWRNCEKPSDDYRHDYVISAYPYAVDWFQLDLNQNSTKYVLRLFGVSKIPFSLMLYAK